MKAISDCKDKHVAAEQRIVVGRVIKRTAQKMKWWKPEKGGDFSRRS